MGMRIAEKKEVVKSLKEVVESSSALVASHYRGMSVSEMSNLRSKGRKKGVKLKIVKNTLAKKALVGSQYEGITDKLVGPIILAFSLEEPNTAAQLRAWIPPSIRVSSWISPFPLHVLLALFRSLSSKHVQVID